MNKIKIIEATTELGLGGTEYVIQLYSKYLNKEYFEVLVVGLNAGGERAKIIAELGISVIILDGDFDRLAKLLQQTDVFHWHGPGTMTEELEKTLRLNKPKLVIQTNVFGFYNPSSHYQTIDYDLYVSKMILIRDMLQQDNLTEDFFKKRKVLPNPVDTDQILSLAPPDSQILQFKENNNLQNSFIIGRIGRADDAKFDLITLDGFAKFLNEIKNARFLLVGATPKILSYAKELGIFDKLIVFENTSNLEQLLLYYKSIDIFLAASRLGESFGLVIAEAMTVGVPVITLGTPYKDNAQVELVDNNKTGIVVTRSSEKIAAAMLYLYKNKHLRDLLSVNSKVKVIQKYEAGHVVRSLENLIYDHLNLPLKNPEKSLIEDLSKGMIIDYNQRCIDLWNHP